MGAGAGARVGQANRFHRAVGQGVFAASGHLLNRQTTLEVATLLERLFRDLFGGQNVVNELIILCLRERAVEIIIAAVVITRGAKRQTRIDRIGCHNRRDSIVEIQILSAKQRPQVFGQGR